MSAAGGAAFSDHGPKYTEFTDNFMVHKIYVQMQCVMIYELMTTLLL